MPDLRHMKHQDSHLSAEIVLLLRLLVPEERRCPLGSECPQCGEADTDELACRGEYLVRCYTCDKDYMP